MVWKRPVDTNIKSEPESEFTDKLSNFRLAFVNGACLKRGFVCLSASCYFVNGPQTFGKKNMVVFMVANNSSCNKIRASFKPIIILIISVWSGFGMITEHRVTTGWRPVNFDEVVYVAVIRNFHLVFLFLWDAVSDIIMSYLILKNLPD